MSTKVLVRWVSQLLAGCWRGIRYHRGHLSYPLPALAPLVSHRWPLLVRYLWNEPKSEVLEAGKSRKHLGITHASQFWGKLWDCLGVEAMGVRVGSLYPGSGEHTALTWLPL